ncbi:MAG: response regulator transcription factor [Bacteroidota bacterium]
MMTHTRILIAEDQEMFRMGMVALLDRTETLSVVAEAANGQEAIQKCLEALPEIVLMDIQLPLLNGIEACKSILEKCPNIKILALTQCEEEEQIINMMKAGAAGYILKDAGTAELKTAIQTLAQGGNYFSQKVSGKLFGQLKSGKQSRDHSRPPHQTLTVREFEVLRFVADEMSNKEIADRLYISPRTVETHKRNLIQKLKVRNTVGLVKYYLQSMRSPTSKIA